MPWHHAVLFIKLLKPVLALMAALPSKIKPKPHECPLVAGCSTAYKAYFLVNGLSIISFCPLKELFSDQCLVLISNLMLSKHVKYHDRQLCSAPESFRHSVGGTPTATSTQDSISFYAGCFTMSTTTSLIFVNGCHS